MSLVELYHAIVLGLVEGMTEFIPVSSTGHLIVAGDLIGFVGERAKLFEVFIQLGAILAVVWIYRRTLASVAQRLPRERAAQRFVMNLFIGFLPAAVVGVFFHEWIKANLFSPVTVGWALIIGGFGILAVERWRPMPRIAAIDDLHPRTALGIGLAQVLALFPGISRSGATIMGAMGLGLSRPAAAEFSFFLAIPVMAAATLFDLIDGRAHLTASDTPLFATGFLVAFLSALVVIRFLLAWVARHSFGAFAWYRIVFGLLVLWSSRG